MAKKLIVFSILSLVLLVAYQMFFKVTPYLDELNESNIIYFSLETNRGDKIVIFDHCVEVEGYEVSTLYNEELKDDVLTYIESIEVDYRKEADYATNSIYQVEIGYMQNNQWKQVLALLTKEVSGRSIIQNLWDHPDARIVKSHNVEMLESLRVQMEDVESLKVEVNTTHCEIP